MTGGGRGREGASTVFGSERECCNVEWRAERGKVIWQVYAWRSEYCQRVRVNAREGPDKRDIRICPEIAT